MSSTNHCEEVQLYGNLGPCLLKKNIMGCDDQITASPLYSSHALLRPQILILCTTKKKKKIESLFEHMYLVTSVLIFKSFIRPPKKKRCIIEVTFAIFLANVFFSLLVLLKYCI